MRLSHSKIRTWRRCPKKYSFRYIDHLRPKQKGIELERGSWIHSLLEAHYDGEDWRDKHKELTTTFYNLFDEEREHLGDLPTECRGIMRRYLHHWKQSDRQLKVIDSELNEIVDIGNGIELNVIIDLIVEDEMGLLWPWDHKTRKRFAEVDDMVLDPQLTLYFRALEIMGYKPLGGVVYNEINTTPPTKPQLLKNGKALAKRKDLKCDVYTYMRELKRYGFSARDYRDYLLALNERHAETFFKRTRLPKDPPQMRTMLDEVKMTRRQIALAEKREEFPRTFEPRNCKWDCEFLDLCIVQMHGGDISSIIKHDFEVSDRGKR